LAYFLLKQAIVANTNKELIEMPTYEYKREDGTTFEITQKMSDDRLTTCPTTGQSVKRIISGGGGVVYKGTGFYVTDYKNGGRANDNGSSEQKEPEPKKASESPKTDSSTE